MRAGVLSALLVVAVAGCGGSSDGQPAKHYFPADFERGFLDSCDRTSGGNTSACRCLLDYVERHESVSDAVVSAGDVSANDSILRDGAKHCVD